MIRVTLRYRGEEIAGFECRGHADYAEAGQDIVCAAVSALTTTCCNALETVAGVKPRVKASSGSMILSIPSGSGRDAQVILLSLRQGMRDIADQYAQYLQLNESQA